jgi:hypothetical protein
MAMTDPKTYDSRPELEGPDNGLLEAVAAKLWCRRSYQFAHNITWESQTQQVKSGWRIAAGEVLTFLIDLGFTGPGGLPTAPGAGLDYGWCYEAADWVIYDGNKGCVALVGDPTDVPLFLAAPKMRDAIQALLDTLAGDAHVLAMPAMVALREALP